jgi:hypothetical protein
MKPFAAVLAVFLALAVVCLIGQEVYNSSGDINGATVPTNRTLMLLPAALFLFLGIGAWWSRAEWWLQKERDWMYPGDGFYCSLMRDPATTKLHVRTLRRLSPIAIEAGLYALFVFFRGY